MGMAVSRSVLYCGIGAAALVWLLALFVIVRTCRRQQREASRSSGSQGTQGTAAAEKPRKRVFAPPLPVLIIQPDHLPDRRSLDLAFQEEGRWRLTSAPCPATQDAKQPGSGGSADGGSQFVVEFAEAGVWLLPDENPRGTGAAGSSRSTHGVGDS
jgi:ABC-type nickel/cobalt efflux system permease component RcnA